MSSLAIEQFFSQFHFMRPYWLLAFIPLVVLLLLRWRRESKSAWKTIIPEHLQKALIIGEQGWKSQLPLKLLSAILSVAIVICAGPTWNANRHPLEKTKVRSLLCWMSVLLWSKRTCRRRA
ncbi:TPR domain protein in aerotolerance operon [Vibrio variabilis]|uniref:TPR domain protein in aerotolerance operon n=1 Tax=Vibrio variabilis TaxID=990271 RepID=A0ABQ0JNP3_9VIBR|nr:TPR domain protein in aerotolerance operon [Vibrio variabilis]